MLKQNHVSVLAPLVRVEKAAALALWQGLDTPISLSCWLLYQHGEFHQLATKKVNPFEYNDWQLFADDYQAVSLLRKSLALPGRTPQVRREVAIEKFHEAEDTCRKTNRWLQRFVDDPLSCEAFHSHPESGFSPLRAVPRVQQWIYRILGPLTRAKLEFAEDNMAFGPGATATVHGVVTQGRKYSNPSPGVTPDLVWFATSKSFPRGWLKGIDSFTVVNHSKLDTVPKNAETDRCICIEPDINIFFQKGVGALLRRQLAHFGLDLSTQENNQKAALTGSLDNSLVTLDLSSASDTVARELIPLLLPYEWLGLLETCRTTRVKDGSGYEYQLEKWSSMGNGYTFELETLIFYAVLLAACEEKGLGYGQVLAYGDDLIYPIELDSYVRSALKFFGFSVNAEKSFGNGPFRESCGADYFMGHNVRPFFFKRKLTDELIETCFTYANGIRDWSSRRVGGGGRDGRCLPSWLRLYRAVPENQRFRVPVGYESNGFVSDFDEAVPTLFTGGGWYGYRFRYRYRLPVRRCISEQGCLTATLNGSGMPFSLGKEALRGRFRGTATKTGYTLEWPDIGPWL